MPAASPLPRAHQPLPGCPGCRERDERIAQFERKIAQLNKHIVQLNKQVAQRDQRIATLEQKTKPVKLNSSNSSIPPSADPPDAPKRPPQKPTGRKRGGQPGHPGHSRQRLPRERVNHTIPIVPDRCDQCQASLPAEPGPNDPEPAWHQFAELPAQAAVVTEYQAHARTCPECHTVTRATIPEELRSHAIGPRLAATLAYLSGCPHVSKRGIEEIVESVMQVPIALGTVSNIEKEMSDALQSAHAEAQREVQKAKIKNVDETGWKQRIKKMWLWAASTATVVCFVIYANRNRKGLLALLGGKIKGIICSDRLSVYAMIPVRFRQVCWAHLKRDFQKLVDLGGEAKPYGERGLAAAGSLFYWWSQYREKKISWPQLRHELEPLREAVKEWLAEGARSSSKAAALCENLLALEPAMWLFMYRKGVEPTNNWIERLLRTAVLWRKIAFGCNSEGGCRFVERILTVVQTLRLQKRPVLEFLREALEAKRAGTTPPKLVIRD